jgi:hypothetical protein
MAQTEEIILKTTIDTGNSAASVKSVKQELRQLTNELATLDPASQKFRDVAQRAGELRDRIDDTNAAVKAFNPEAKFQAFAGVFGGVANGFSALQGAMQIFGDKNKDVEKAIQQTQGAIALATGVNGLLGMKDQFVILSNVIKTQVATSFNTLGKAIKSTGIIALVASLGVLIYEWYKEKKAAEDAAAATKKAQEQHEAYSEKIKDLRVENMRGRERELANIKRNMNHQLHEIDKALKEETYSVQQAEELKKQIRTNAAKEQSELLAKFEREDHQKRLDNQIKLGEDLIAIEKAKGVETIAQVEKVFALEQAMLELKKNAVDEEGKALMTKQEYEAKSIAIAKQASDARKAIELAEFNQKMSNAEAVSGALTGLGQLAGQQTEAGKALAVASATIDTYVGASKALAQGGIFGKIAAVGIIASGLANVTKIISTKVPKVAGGNGGGFSTPAPAAPVLPPTSNATRLVNGNEPVITRTLDVKENKVYVLEKDITKAQGTVSNIRDQATVQ